MRDAPILTKPGQEEVIQHLRQSLSASFGSLAKSVLLKGSLHKGDFIPYFSDMDIHVFVASEAMLAPLVPRLSYSLAFQEHFGTLEPECYGVSQFQVYFIDAENYPQEWTPPLPGTYQTLLGSPPQLALPTKEQMQQRAADFLDDIPRQAGKLIGRFVDKPDRGVAPVVRLLATMLKPAAYQIAILCGQDPFRVWCRPLREILEVVEPRVGVRGWSDFYNGVQDWPAVRCRGGQLRKLFTLGIQTLEQAYGWHSNRVAR